MTIITAMGLQHVKIVELLLISTVRTKMEALSTALLVITKNRLPISPVRRARLEAPVPLVLIHLLVH